jgi:hypothetical protein
MATLRGRSPAVLAREYLALASGAYDRKSRDRALNGLEMLVAGFMDPADRPPALRRLPRATHLVRANQLLTRRLDQATEVAHRLVDHDGDVLGMTRAIAAQRVSRPGWKPMAPRDVYRHTVRPFLPTVHLLPPLIAARMPEFAKRYPELAPAIPRKLVEATRTEHWPFERLEGLLLDDRWVFAAIDASGRWRELIARRAPLLAEVMVQVRTQLTDD